MLVLSGVPEMSILVSEKVRRSYVMRPVDSTGPFWYAHQVPLVASESSLVSEDVSDSDSILEEE